jgi:hypothetical protein
METSLNFLKGAKNLFLANKFFIWEFAINLKQ